MGLFSRFSVSFKQSKKHKRSKFYSFILFFFLFIHFKLSFRLPYKVRYKLLTTVPFHYQPVRKCDYVCCHMNATVGLFISELALLSSLSRPTGLGSHWQQTRRNKAKFAVCFIYKLIYTIITLRSY